LGQQAKTVGVNFHPHHGQFSSGIGEGLRLESLLERDGRGRGRVSGGCRPSCPCGSGVAAWPTHRPISKGHGPSFSHVLLALELERADQRGGAAELVEREQPQRVAHQHATRPRRLQAGVAQPAQHQRERREAQVRLGLAAAGREEQQVDELNPSKLNKLPNCEMVNDHIPGRAWSSRLDRRN
jgi:hypothetical protein